MLSSALVMRNYFFWSADKSNGRRKIGSFKALRDENIMTKEAGWRETLNDPQKHAKSSTGMFVENAVRF